MLDPIAVVNAVLGALNVLATLLQRASDAFISIKKAKVNLIHRQNRVGMLLANLQVLQAMLPTADGAGASDPLQAALSKTLSSATREINALIAKYGQAESNSKTAAADAFFGSVLDMQLDAIDKALKTFTDYREGNVKLIAGQAQELRRGGKTLLTEEYLTEGHQPNAAAFQKVCDPNACDAVTRVALTKCDQKLQRCDKLLRCNGSLSLSFPLCFHCEGGKPDTYQ